MASNETLTVGARQLIEAAREIQKKNQQEQLGVNHWLLALVQNYGPMAESLTTGFEAATLERYLREQLRQENHGNPLPIEDVEARAYGRAVARGKIQATERDLVAAILVSANYTVVTPNSTATTSAKASAAPPTSGSKGSPSASLTPPTSESSTPISPADPSSVTPIASPTKPTRPTPLLEQFGRDLTREAREGKLPPVVGREAEVQLMLETLSRTTKRNPVLVGPAGSGKTALVEGLAQRIVRGDVPETIRGSRLLAIQPSTLVAGAGVVGELEKRMRGLLSEASQDGILLFIDEVHSIIGAGGAPGSSDMASLLKPALARGEIACIAATTDDEYRRFIEQDAALERRFQPIRIQEMTPDQALTVLSTLRDALGTRRGVKVGDDVLKWLIDFAQRYLRNRYFPDKGVDLLEQCVAYAITHGRESVTQAEAEAVAQRMIGMPLSIEAQLEPLRTQLIEQALLPAREIETLSARLEVTLRGLDLRSARPNAVLLLLNEAATASEALAGVIAERLFGGRERVISIDFSRFVHPADVTMLIGAPPGYVGYSDSLPLHRLTQTPWSVLRCEHIDASHPQVLAVMLQALASGVLTDARGRRLYLSDTIVILTASVGIEENRSIGFRQAEPSNQSDLRQAATETLGEGLVSLVDIICADIPLIDAAQRHFLQRLLSDLADRYKTQGLILQWDSSLIDWLTTQQSANASQLDWERLVDERVSPLLIRNLPSAGVKRELLVRYVDGSIQITPLEPTA